MKYRHNIIIILLTLIVGWFIYYDCIRFEVKRELIYQCQDFNEKNRSEIFVYYANINDICTDYPELKTIIETKFKCTLDKIDTNKYKFLKVCGGEIDSFKMVKDTKNWFPYIKYKQGISKDTVSIYLMTPGRYIEFGDI